MARRPIPFCNCGKRVIITTSWTDKNPGRRFEKCVNKGSASCNHWAWYDDDMCPRSKKVIPGLLKKLNEKNVMIKELQESNARLSRHNDRLVGKVLNGEGSQFDYAEIASQLPLPSSDSDELDELEESNFEEATSQFHQSNGHEQKLEEELGRLKVKLSLLSVVIAFGFLVYVWHVMGIF